MSYYENKADFDKRGIDYDLRAAIKYNNPGFDAEDIDFVHALHEGEKDGNNWVWILSLKDGRLCHASGGCDYTGWDCQSDLDITFAKTLEQCAEVELAADNLDVYHGLIYQLTFGEPWRAMKAAELGIGRDFPAVKCNHPPPEKYPWGPHSTCPKCGYKEYPHA